MLDLLETLEKKHRKSLHQIDVIRKALAAPTVEGDCETEKLVKAAAEILKQEDCDAKELSCAALIVACEDLEACQGS